MTENNQVTTENNQSETAEGNQTTFQTLNLLPAVVKALEESGYKVPTPIQEACLPLLMAGKDLLGIAQTGTGKTAAFALPILNQVDVNQRVVQSLVLTPTRELALQVSEAFKRYSKYVHGFKVLPIYGGSDFKNQLKGLKAGAQVVVGTPGRIMDLIRRGHLDLSCLDTLVLDEADEMLRMGFIDDVTWILDQIPEQRQVALFSATMPNPIRKVARQYMNEPEEVKIQAKTVTVDQIDQSYWMVKGINKLDGLTRILEVEDVNAAIIFARTKMTSVELSDKLVARGFSAEALNGDMTQKAREHVVDKMKRGVLNILVATDVAARGIDIPRVSHVINYDVPYDVDSYVHRIGRTGRAGRSGSAIIFVAPREQRILKLIERITKHKIKEYQLPSRNEVESSRVEKIMMEMKKAVLDSSFEKFQTLASTFKAKYEMSELDVAAAALFLAQKDKPLFLSGETRERVKPVDKASKSHRSKSKAPKKKFAGGMGSKGERERSGNFKSGNSKTEVRYSKSKRGYTSDDRRPGSKVAKSKPTKARSRPAKSYKLGLV